MDSTFIGVQTLLNQSNFETIIFRVQLSILCSTSLAVWTLQFAPERPGLTLALAPSYRYLTCSRTCQYADTARVDTWSTPMIGQLLEQQLMCLPSYTGNQSRFTCSLQQVTVRQFLRFCHCQFFRKCQRIWSTVSLKNVFSQGNEWL